MELENTNLATEKQWKCIRWIQHETGYTFMGRTKQDAQKWIGENIEAAKALAASRGHKTPDEQTAPAKDRKPRQQLYGDLLRMSYPALKAVARRAHTTLSDISRTIGQGSNYLSNRHSRSDDTIPSAAVELIEKKTGIPRDTFIIIEKQPEPAEPVQIGFDLEEIDEEPAETGTCICLDKGTSDLLEKWIAFSGLDANDYVSRIVTRDLTERRLRATYHGAKMNEVSE